MSEKEIVPVVGEKQRRWNEVCARVEKITDKLGKHIDSGIKEGVVALACLEVNTTGSCEGHSDHGTYAPYIDIEADGVEELNKKLAGLVKEDKEGARDIIAEIERRNLKERTKIFAYLDEFYNDRSVPFGRRLMVEGLARGWSRLESQGVDMQKIASAVEREKNLSEYQEEMKEFIAFLKKRYFEGNN